MRKLFWGCMAGGVMIFGGVFTLTQIAIRHPDSFVARLLYGTGHIASQVNPYSGSTSLVAKLEKQEQNFKEVASGGQAFVEGIPDDPTPIGEEPQEPLPPIVIPEDPLPAQIDIAPMPVPETGTGVQPFDPGTECPRAQFAPLQPMLMPYCEDEGEVKVPAVTGVDSGFVQVEYQIEEMKPCEKLHMPKRCDEIEPLSMPHVEEEQEPGKAACNHCCPLQFIGQAFQVFNASIRNLWHAAAYPTATPVEDQPEPMPAHTDVPECREDRNHHQHYSGCPATGGHHAQHCTRYNYPHVYPAPIKVTPETPKQTGAEESSEKPEGHSLLRRLQMQMKRGTENCPVHPEVDTMEFRPSDRPLSDYGTGPL